MISPVSGECHIFVIDGEPVGALALTLTQQQSIPNIQVAKTWKAHPK
jgi:hypothetical protein